MVSPLPDDYPRISVTLCLHDAKKAMELYSELFGAQRQLVLTTEDGRIRHAQLRVGDSLLLLNDEFPEEETAGPRTLGGSPVTMLIYVDDVDDVFARALNLGCRQLKPVRDQFYGDRTGKLVDPFRHRWSIASRIEKVSLAEIAKRAAG